MYGHGRGPLMGILTKVIGVCCWMSGPLKTGILSNIISKWRQITVRPGARTVRAIKDLLTINDREAVTACA